MFVIATVLDVIRIPPALLSSPTVQAIHSEIDQRYPNRVLLDVGLVISRYGDCLQVGHGVCVAGDGGAHHECEFRLIVFRPFVNEVCVGKIVRSSAQGIQVSTGFFDEIFIPAYWMLQPSLFEESAGLWVWSPEYENEEEAGGPNRYVMEDGADVRFKVKSINFTQITKTAKGLQATTTTMAHQAANHGGPPLGAPAVPDEPPRSSEVADSSLPMGRQRSSSIGLDATKSLPAAMLIVASICEDGLGLTSWWTSADGEQDRAEPESLKDRKLPATKLENGT